MDKFVRAVKMWLKFELCLMAVGVVSVLYQTREMMGTHSYAYVLGLVVVCLVRAVFMFFVINGYTTQSESE